VELAVGFPIAGAGAGADIQVKRSFFSPPGNPGKVLLLMPLQLLIPLLLLLLLLLSLRMLLSLPVGLCFHWLHMSLTPTVCGPGKLILGINR
jgi:hypothetical protein